MASTFLKVGILLFGLTFVLSAPVEEEKKRSPRFLEIFDTGLRESQPELTWEEQAMAILAEQNETRETVEDLNQQAKELNSFALTLESEEFFSDDDEIPSDDEAVSSTDDAVVPTTDDAVSSTTKKRGSFKKLISTVRKVAKKTIRIADLVRKNAKEISAALVDAVVDVDDVVSASATEISKLATEISNGITEAEDIVDKVGTVIKNHRTENLSEELDQTADLIADAMVLVNGVGQHTANFEDKAEKAGKDLVQIMRRARDRISKSVKSS
ncbi:hypothetical protein PoB_004274100 [Plakobranchus ocellatus]|uniref:Uncharacterized protein n=1 Tax=Plakobranchus ocellatus TaxID=259542 RepID=A0AAV4B703_9GAST|nr:hypothetical protein PoB_004274100 [Plakobranchus ocellatus]